MEKVENNRMEGSAGILIGALAVLLLGSAFFSASETAFSSVNHIRLKSMAAEGNKRAVRAIAVVEDYDNMLSAVLIGNNIVNILSSSLATVLFVGFFGNLGVTISTVVMTVLVLIFGEISPKTLAREAPEQFTLFAAPILRFFMVVFFPLGWLFGQWKKLILKLFKVGGGRPVSEEELLTYVGEVRQEGGINEGEEAMIRQAIEFDDLEAVDILTPRVDIEAVALDDDNEEIAKLFFETGYSRLPVYKETMDSIVGVLLQKDFHYKMEHLGKPLREVMRPILFVTEYIKVPVLLRELQQQKLHMAVVVDEFGGTLGIVTIEDVVEELVGDIWDEHDEVVENYRQTGEDTWAVLGAADLDDFFERFGIQVECDANTVGGWVVEELGRIPQAGDAFSFEGLDIAVSLVARHRVVEITVKKKAIPPPAEEDEGTAKAEE